MREVLFKVGPFTIYGYGFMVALGVLAAFLVGMYREKKYKVGDDQIFSMGIWCLVCGWGAAKVLFVITELPTLFSNPRYFLDTLASGFVVYGGLIGGILTGYIFCRVKKLSFLKYFDLVMPSIALAQGIGRFGCVMAGCCYGKVTESAFHIIFPESCNYAPAGVPLIPTQFISAGANFLNFFALLFCAKRTKSDGQVGGLYLIFYSIGRFIIECFRDDPRGSVGPLSTSQFIAIFMLIAGIAIFVYCGKKYPKVKEEEKNENTEEENGEEQVETKEAEEDVAPEEETETEKEAEQDATESEEAVAEESKKAEREEEGSGREN